MATFTIRCAKCGSDDLVKPDNPKPDDNLTCNGCGETTRWGDVEAELAKATEQALKNSVTRSGFKFK